MSNEVEVMDAVAVQNYQAAHSVMVMEQWGNGETYDEPTWIERGRQAVRQTMEGMFELGRALICTERAYRTRAIYGNRKRSIWYRP